MMTLKMSMYGSNSQLFTTDTDSLMYEIKAKDVYEDKDKEMFDFSNYSVLSKYNDSNKLVFGKMKDETGGVAVTIWWIEAKDIFILSRW